MTEKWPWLKSSLRAWDTRKDKPFEFDLWYTPSHYGDTEVNMAEVLKAQLEKTPLVKVNIKSAEWATYKQQWDQKQMAVFPPGLVSRLHRS